MANTKVLLINPPNPERKYINRDLMGGMGVQISFGESSKSKFVAYLKSQSIKLPVLSLAYAAAVLDGFCEVKVIDAANTRLSRKKALELSESFNPEISFLASSTPGLLSEIDFGNQMKEKIGTKIGFIGETAAILSAEIFKKSNIDFIVKGEPESVVTELINTDKWNLVNGIAFKQDGRIIDNPRNPFIENLDDLPFPAWDYFPVDTYQYFPLIRKKPFLPVLASRGCPYGCIYCPYSANMGTKWRSRTPENVIEELERNIEDYKIKGVQFRDPLFAFDKRWTISLCNQMVDKKLDLEWGCETRADCLDVEIIKKMARSGCMAVNIGIESTDPKVLKNVKRKWFSLDGTKKIISLLNDFGIRVAGFFIIGLPGETKEGIEKTIDFSLSLDLSYAEYKIATPFPGTRLHDLAIQNNWIEEELSLAALTSYSATMRISDELTPAYMEKCCDRAFKNFYFRPKVIRREILRRCKLL